jgi:membrane protein DedA with SNARE-associated domain
MHDLMALIIQHGYLLVSGIVFAEAIGLPVPAAVGLVGAGAAAASGILHPGLMLFFVLLSMMAGDSLLFVLGRYTGWTLLGLLCRVSVNPESCILRSAESFYKYGRLTLLFIKFIPGVNTMAAPLAGSMKMKLGQFLRLDFAGACFYILAYGAAGYAFRDLVAHVTRGLQTGSHTVVSIALLALVAFAAYRIVQYFRYRVHGSVPSVGVEEIALRLASEGNKEVILADVRSHGYYDSGTQRIAGSIRIEPSQLAKELNNLPRDKDIYLYCT